MIFFKAPQNQFVSEISKKSTEDKAKIVIAATVSRMLFARDNPEMAEIFLDPFSYSSEVCEKVFFELVSVAAAQAKQNKAYQSSLNELGGSQSSLEAGIHGVRVWSQTIGARCGKVKWDDCIKLWSFLNEGMQALEQALSSERSEREFLVKLGISAGPYLGGLPEQLVIDEASRLPRLGR